MTSLARPSRPGTLGDGQVTEPGDYSYSCVFPFTLSDVGDAKFYRLSVGKDRGDVTYSRNDIEARKWQVELSLGASVR